jgi:hypothetical protein
MLCKYYAQACEQRQLPAQHRELPRHGLERLQIAFAETREELKSGVCLPVSQIASTLLWHSAFSSREERTRCR